jgi:hypothetical protein
VTTTIRGGEQLTALFGRWPSFHDAEIVRLTLDRDMVHDRASGPTLTLDVYAFESGPGVAPSGQYVLRNEVLISLRFLEVDQLALNGFNQQNAIWNLYITDISERQLERAKYEVHVAPSFGVGATFLCFDVEVIAVRPWVAADHASQGGPEQ